MVNTTFLYNIFILQLLTDNSDYFKYNYNYYFSYNYNFNHD